jgi:hypothetical protein
VRFCHSHANLAVRQPAHVVGDVFIPMLAGTVRRGQVMPLLLSVRSAKAVANEKGELTVLFVYAGGDVDTPLPNEIKAARRLRPGFLSFTVVEAQVDWRHRSMQHVGPANFKVTVQLDRKTGDVSTPAHRKVLSNPVWNTQFRVQIYDPERDSVNFHLKAHRDKMLRHKIDHKTDDYHTPSIHVASARFPALAVAAFAALHGGSSEIDIWLPLLERKAETRIDNKEPPSGRIHVVFRFEPMALSDDNDGAAAAVVVGANVRIERRPFAGGAVLLSNDVKSFSFQGRPKDRRAVLVDGSGHLPPHLLLEEPVRPVRAFMSIVPAVAIMPNTESEANTSNSSFDDPLMRQDSSSSNSQGLDVGGGGAGDADDADDDVDDDDELANVYSSGGSSRSLNGGGAERGLYGRVLILPNSKVTMADAVTLQVEVYGTTPAQVIAFKTPAIADRWRRALLAMQPTRARWYADAREAKWSNVADLKLTPPTIGVDNARSDVALFAVDVAAVNRAVAARSAAGEDPLRAPAWLVDSLLANAPSSPTSGTSELPSTMSSSSSSSNYAVPQATTYVPATSGPKRFLGNLGKAASKQTESLKKKAQAIVSVIDTAAGRCSRDESTEHQHHDNDMKSASENDEGKSGATHSTDDDGGDDLPPPLPPLPSKAGGKARPTPPPKGDDSPYGFAPPERSDSTYTRAPAPLDVPYVVTPSRTDSTIDELIRSESAPAHDHPDYETVPPLPSAPAATVSLLSLPVAASGGASGTVTAPKSPRRSSDDSRRMTSVFLAVPPAAHQVVYADPEASMSANDDADDAEADDDIVDDHEVAVATMFERLPRKYRVAFDELGSLSDEIGRGIGGVVYKARFREADVAVKMIDAKDAEIVRDFLEEAMLLLELPPHPNVIIPVGLSQKPLCIVMMFCERGSLWGVLSSQAPPRIERRIAILRDVAAGMHHVGREGIVHKDLAARNILLTAGDTALVSDFGLSRIANERGSVYDSGICSIKWSAPEAVLSKRYSTASDVWSFAVVVVETMTCKPPLPTIGTSEYLLRYAEKCDEYAAALVASLPTSAPAVLRRVAEQCLQNDPKKRPSFSELCGQLRAVLRTSPSGSLELVSSSEL